MEINEKTGFKVLEFNDFLGNACSVKKSDFSIMNYLWIGVNQGHPKILASNAKKHKLKTKEKHGWIDYPIPKDVVINTSMMLTQENVKALLPILEKFVRTGKI